MSQDREPQSVADTIRALTARVTALEQAQQVKPEEFEWVANLPNRLYRLVRNTKKGSPTNG